MAQYSVTLWGSHLRAPTVDRWVALQAHRLGLMGRDIRHILESHVRPGMCVADVGANQGIFTNLLCRLVGPTGYVTAFEPNPWLADALRDNLAANRASNVRLFQAGAGAEPGDATLFLSPYNAGDNRLALGDLPRSCEKHQVKMMRFDDAIPNHKVDFIKIDTQGWEINVLEGMTACLAENAALVIVLEFWPHGLRQAGRDPAHLVTMLLDHGFHLRDVSNRMTATRASVATLISSLTGKKSTDLLATRRASRGLDENVV